MARESRFSLAQREAAQLILDAAVANVPAVVAARRALAAADETYQAALQPRLAAKRRVDELRAELASVQQQIEEADARRVEVALGVADGELSSGAYHALCQMLDEARLEAERIELSMPAIEARYHAHSTPIERAAHSQDDAQRALSEAIKAAKLDRAMAEGA